jgi:hypothetical protein
MRVSIATPVLAVLAAGCVEAEPLTPAFEQRVFSVLGGLEVGEALTLSGIDAQSIVLPGGEEGARYVFVPFLAAEEGAVRLRVAVSGNDLDPLPAGASAPARVPAPFLPSTLTGPEMRDDRGAHMRLREWERQRVQAAFRDGNHRVRPATAALARVAEQAIPATAVGETVSLQVINRNPENTSICQNPHQRTGRVTAITENAILVEDVLNPVALSAADVQRIADEYEQLVHPVAVENFGEPTDVDGNGRVYIFMTSALNETASRAGGGITVGFTFALDLLPRVSSTGGSGCAASNEAEIFYLIAPDPEGVIGLKVPEELVQRLSTSIIVHEMQHMINAGRRLYEVEAAEEFEELWLNEGLSHIAEELVFYAATGFRPRTDINWGRVTTAEANFTSYHRFIRDNLSIYANYLRTPDDESLMGKSPSDDDFTTRGATWAFLRYLADQTPGEDAALFRALVNSPIGGLENLERALETDPLTWMQRWTVANYTDNLPEDEGIDARFTQPSWNFRSIFEGELGSIPLALRLLQPDTSLSVILRGGGSSYLVLGAKSGRQARLTTTRAGAPVFGEFRASVVRIE